jgi:hypothetical protein
MPIRFFFLDYKLLIFFKLIAAEVPPDYYTPTALFLAKPIVYKLKRLLYFSAFI